MSLQAKQRKSKIVDYLSVLREESVRNMLFLGFSAGLPILLLFSTLSVWLREAGTSRSTVSFFAWAGLGYSFKFIWAPLIDQARLPFFNERMGKRRSWLLLCQGLLVTTILLMSQVNPTNETSLVIMAILAVALGFFSASQDIVIDALRIEMTPPKLLGMSSATYQLGYRLAMIVSTAGAFILADHFGSAKDRYHYEAWKTTYLIMAICMLSCLFFSLIFVREPKNRKEQLDSRGSLELVKLIGILLVPFIGVFLFWDFIWALAFGESYKSRLDTLTRFLFGFTQFSFAIGTCIVVAKILIKQQFISTKVATKAYVSPIREFINRYPRDTVILIMLLIGFYRVSDIVLGVQANVFYFDLGFTKTEIGTASKVFGIIMTLVGMFLGGYMVTRFGTIKTLLWGAILSALTNLLFMILAQAGNNLTMLYFVISADNLSGGIATTAFITFLSRLSNIEFTAMQYAIFSSVMIMIPKIISGYSGTMVDASSYSSFFLITTAMGLPVIALVLLVNHRLTLNEDKR